MPIATRDDLFGGFQRRHREVPISGGRTVRIQNLTELERSRLIEAPRLNAADEAALRKARQEEPCRWLLACLVDGDGKRMFKAEDIPLLQQLDAADSRAIYVAAMEHVGSVPNVGDLEKNCGATNDGSSSSD